MEDSDDCCDSKIDAHVAFLFVAFTTHKDLFNWMNEHYMLTMSKEKRAIDRILMYIQRKNKAALYKLIRRNQDVEYVLYHITDAYESMFLEGVGPNPHWATEADAL